MAGPKFSVRIEKHDEEISVQRAGEGSERISNSTNPANRYGYIICQANLLARRKDISSG